MHQVNLKEAETQLAKLIEEAANGEEVVITRSDGTSFRRTLSNMLREALARYTCVSIVY